MTRQTFRISQAARRDLDAYTDHLASEAGVDVAHRFIERARASLAALGASPGIGSPVPTINPRLSGLRKGKVNGFPKLLIFYIPQGNSIRVVRVLHAAQDWWSLLDVN